MSLRAISAESPAFTSMPSWFQTGRPVVLALTASWCPHCIRFKPTVKAAAGEAAGRHCCSIVCVDLPLLATTNPPLYAELQPMCPRGYPTVVRVVRDGATLRKLAEFKGNRNVEELLLFASEQTTLYTSR